MPRVSVVTGFYNRGALLERTIASILGQTYTDLELIVFDDKSSDDTAARLSRLAERYQDSRFRYIVHDRNKGFVRGLRDAIAESSGQYIAIQGSGDASLPTRLERQVELLDERPDVGVVGGWYYNVDEGTGARRLRRPNADQVTFEDLLQANVFSHGEVMIRRSIYDRVGGYRTAFTYAQDRDLWLRVARVARFATVPEPLYDRYVQLDGVSYFPHKRVSQTYFSVAAGRLAQLPPEEEAVALALIEESGPTAIIEADDPILQKSLELAALRIVLFGSPESGIQLARSHVTSRVKRFAIVAFGRWFGSPLSAPLRPLVWRAVGIKS